MSQRGAVVLPGEAGGTTVGGTGAVRSSRNTEVAGRVRLPAVSLRTTESVYEPSGSAVKSAVKRSVQPTGPATTSPVTVVTVHLPVVAGSLVQRHTGFSTGDGLAGDVRTGIAG